jgi:hypothetical protein
MTRIRYLLQAFRARRNRRHLSRTESVSFEAFCNEAPPAEMSNHERIVAERRPQSVSTQETKNRKYSPVLCDP